MIPESEVPTSTSVYRSNHIDPIKTIPRRTISHGFSYIGKSKITNHIEGMRIRKNEDAKIHRSGPISLFLIQKGLYLPILRDDARSPKNPSFSLFLI